MKRILLTFITIFYTIISIAQTNPTNYYKNLRLNGHIKSIQKAVNKTALNSDGSTTTIEYQTLTEFDFEGNILQVSVYKRGKLFSNLKYIYQDTVPIRAIDYNADGSIYMTIN